MLGTKVNNYEIVSQIGEGGMGAVYLARHPLLDRTAAIKVLRDGLARDQSLVHRFFNEARAAAAIRHPNIIDVIDVGTLPGSQAPYLMMEYLEGENLAARLKRVGRLSVAEASALALQTASALGAAHAKGIVHRDLKPENLFLVRNPQGAGELVKVLDFGIAKLHGEMSADQVKTQTGALMGTPPYMSPEQCRGLSAQIDHRTDVYALGIILYEMLCGGPPFLGAGFGDILVMHLTQAPPPPRARNPEIPVHIEAVILKALAKSADERFAGMRELQQALDGVPGQTVALPIPAVVTPAPIRTDGGPTLTESSPVIERGTTTFSSVASERGDVLPGAAPRRRGVLVAAGAGLLAVAGGAFAFRGRSDEAAVVPAAPDVTLGRTAGAAPASAPPPGKDPGPQPATNAGEKRPAAGGHPDAGAPRSEPESVRPARKPRSPRVPKPSGPEKW